MDGWFALAWSFLSGAVFGAYVWDRIVMRQLASKQAEEVTKRYIEALKVEIKKDNEHEQ